MKVIDTNKWLNPPEGFGDPVDVFVHGGCICVEYCHTEYWDANCTYKRHRATVVIYLNDMGREVLRTTDDADWAQPEPPQPTPELSWWVRFNLWVFDLCSLSMFSRRIK